GLKSPACAGGVAFEGARGVLDGIQSTAVGLRRNSDTLPGGPSIDPPVIVETPSIFSSSSDPRVMGWWGRRPFSRENTRYPNTRPYPGSSRRLAGSSVHPPESFTPN